MTTKSVLATTLLLIGTSPAIAAADIGLLRTTYALDEARGYCIDIAGFGESLRLDDPLQVHTCKYGAALEDQLFEPVAGTSRVRVPEYDRCLATAALDEGSALVVQPCAESPLQRWSFSWGRLSPESRPDLCVSLSGETGEAAGTPALITPVYRRRDIALAPCDAQVPSRQTFRWSSPDERGLSTADSLRHGMPDDVASRVAAFGREFDGAIAGQTTEIYATVPRTYEPAEIEVTQDLAYGPHERQQLSIHRSTMRRADGPVPVVVIFHGGGLVGGNRAGTEQVADYFASLGLVGASAGYRLAPDYAWPEGARDVGAAVTWLRDHVAEYGGDPNQIFVSGISTGALHAATYLFRPELMPPGTARPAGAILFSGPYTFDFEHPSPGERAYFGEDPSRWADMVVPGNVTRSDIPVLFTTAEWDHPRYTRAFAELLDELANEHGVMPRYAQSLGHNHLSQLLSLGTADTSVSTEIVDFIERTVGR